MKRSLSLIAGLLVAGLALTSCSSSTASGEPKDAVTIAVAAQPPTLDPHISTASITLEIMRNVFETLITQNAEGESVPMLAEEITKSDDGKTYTFTLRPGIQFHNGNPLTAEDVVASMNRWQNESSTAQMLQGAEFNTTDQDDEVLLTLETPNNDTLDILAGYGQFPAIMPKDIIEGATDTGVSEFIGTGPFTFGEWKQDEELVLHKYENYVSRDEESSGLAGQKNVKFDDLHWKFVTDSSTRIAGVQTGLYDVAETIPADDYLSLLDDDRLEVDTYLYASLLAVYNKKAGNTADVKFRQAINTALDMDQIMAAAFPHPDLYVVDGRYTNPSENAWDSEGGLDQYNQKDLDKAKELLSESNYDGEPIHVLATRDYPYSYKAAVMVQQQLEPLGITVNLDVYDWATLTSKRSETTGWDFFIGSVGYVSTPSQLIPLRPSFAGAEESNEEKDAHLHAMASAESHEEALEIWDQLQEYMWEYLPATNLGHFSEVVISSNNVNDLSLYRGVVPWNMEVTG